MVGKAISKMDDRGRVLIPKGIRKRLMLKAGDVLLVEVVGESIVLRPVRKIRKVRARDLKEVFFDAGEAAFGD